MCIYGLQVDALLPALEYFQSLPKSCTNEILDGLLLACSVADEGAKKTAGMQARYLVIEFVLFFVLQSYF